VSLSRDQQPKHGKSQFTPGRGRGPCNRDELRQLLSTHHNLHIQYPAVSSTGSSSESPSIGSAPFPSCSALPARSAPHSTARSFNTDFPLDPTLHLSPLPVAANATMRCFLDRGDSSTDNTSDEQLRMPPRSQSTSQIATCSPHFIGKATLGSETPHTKSILNDANRNYKTRLMVENPWPNSHVRTLFAREAWGLSHETHGPDDSTSIKFSGNVESVVSAAWFRSTFTNYIYCSYILWRQRIKVALQNGSSKTFPANTSLRTSELMLSKT
jgi:hypothetical protein